MKVLVIDDEKDFLEQSKLFLEKENDNLEIETINSPEKGLELIRENNFGCIVSDYKMPEMDGLDLLEKIRDKEIDIPFIMMTGKGDEKVAMQSANLGVERYLRKSGEPRELFENLSKTIEQISKHKKKNEYVVAWLGQEAPIKRFATETLVGVDKGTTVQEATQRMVNLDIDSLVVLDDSEIVGFFTDGDIRRKVTAKGLKPDLPVENIMETDLITIDIGATVGEAIDLMSKRNIKHLLTAEKGEIKGIITFGDIIGMERYKIETYISRE